ncbi:MAG: hypothetical protein ABII76_12890, partial [Pseudomonadota bacterium]
AGAGGGGEGSDKGQQTQTQTGDQKQAPASSQTAGQTQGQQQGQTPGEGSRKEDFFSWEAMHEVREESKARRLKIDELEKKIGTIESENAGLKGQLKSLVVGSAVEAALKAAGATAPDLIVKAGLLGIDSVDLDGEGKPDAAKLAARIEALKKDRADLFPVTTGGTGKGQAGGNGAGAGEIDAATKGTPPAKPDFATMPKEDLDKVVERVKMGEKIQA